MSFRAVLTGMIRTYLIQNCYNFSLKAYYDLPEKIIAAPADPFQVGTEQQNYSTVQIEGKRMNREVYLTQEGKQKLEVELEDLLSSRQELSRELESISAEGLSFEDLDPAYEAVRHEIAMLESRIFQIQDILLRGRIIPELPAHDVVMVGSKVRLQIGDDGAEEFLLVGSAEANPREGRISNESPVGRTILGKRAGEDVFVHTPEGDLRIMILEHN
jgi:transcription elongation factor GreA